MQPEDMSGGAGRAEAIERRLLIRTIPKETLRDIMLLDAALGMGEHIDLDLGAYVDQEYINDWKVLSHTFTLQPEGAALLTLLVERTL
jgi:hypothetical protein